MMMEKRTEDILLQDLSTTPQTSTIWISLVSNSRLLQDGLATLLREYLEFQLVGTYTSDLDPMMELNNPAFHIVLVDAHIGYKQTLEWIHYWHSRYPPACVLIVEMGEDVEMLLSFIEAGASGFTLCGASTYQVSEMIQLAMQGRAKCSPKIIARLFKHVASLKSKTIQMQEFAAPLTERELEVMSYVVQGYRNREIAEALVVTVRTVKYHMHNILEKLSCKNRHEAANMAVNQGWING